MSQAFDKMIKQLSLEPVSEDIFLGESTDLLGTGRIFGGQVLGQALMAASLTVDPQREVHSLHAYFIRPGDVNLPIRFEVERVRDGGSFTNRRVVAYQNDKHIFTMATSFQTPEIGFEHYDPMPEVKSQDNFLNESQLIQQIAHTLPKSITKRHLIDGNPIEIRPAHPERFVTGGSYPAHTYYWFKANGSIDSENALLHKATLAYLTDFYLIFASLFPHNQGCFDPAMQMASLDHALWFHRPININDWNLYVIDSPNASGGRGLCFGRIYNQKGELLATSAQEGLIRNTSRFGSDK